MDDADMNIDWVGRSRALTPQVRNFVNGRWIPVGGDPLRKLNPRDGKLLYGFGVGQAREVDDAVSAARAAFADGRWSKLPTQRRKEVLFKLATLIETHADELALLECLDVGKPISAARSFDIPAVAGVVKFYAEAVDKFYGKVYGVDESNLSYQLRRPMGVVAAIVGWNFPLLLAAGKVGPVLVTGSSLVLKPSELTSLSASRLAELALEAGVPEGVFNVVHGDARVGAALAKHMDVDLVTFTGSTQTGKKLLIASGESNMKRLILECGGKAPNIVFEDSPDLELVAESVVARAFYNQGAVCTASSRLLIQESIKEQLMPLIIAKAAAWRPGDPLLAETKFGALVTSEHKRKVLSYLESGEREGARIVFGSKATMPVEGGFYVPPVIFDGVRAQQRIAQEEIFGPVLSVISFRDEQEAIRIANGTIYGLSAILWTKDLSRAHRVTHAINVGWTVVNATGRPSASGAAFSVGGHKASGIGTEGGIEGLEEYVTKTAVQLFV